jgi:hypothetical protein
MAFKISPAAASANYFTASRSGGSSGPASAAAAAESRGTPFYPTIGLHTKNEEVSVNFGASPFTFDVDAYEEDVLAEFEATLSSCDIPPLPLMNMVRQHLAFTGMHASLQALDKQVKFLFSPGETVLLTISFREAVCSGPTQSRMSWQLLLAPGRWLHQLSSMATVTPSCKCSRIYRLLAAPWLPLPSQDSRRHTRRIHPSPLLIFSSWHNRFFLPSCET